MVATGGALASYSKRACYTGIGECSVYVAPEARGQGVGMALAEALAGEAERRGFHKLLGKLFTNKRMVVVRWKSVSTS
jgi:L-amino acid N-acyltransferase YncA